MKNIAVIGTQRAFEMFLRDFGYIDKWNRTQNSFEIDDLRFILVRDRGQIFGIGWVTYIRVGNPADWSQEMFKANELAGHMIGRKSI